MRNRNAAAAIQEVYRTFEGYPLHLTAFCPCCLQKRERQTLSTTPLSLLTAEEVRPYAISAMLTVGTAEDVKYFLPRLFELLVVENDWPGRERFLDILVRADWSHWPPAEQHAIREALLAHWDTLLTACGPSYEVCEYLNALAHAQEPLDPLLQQWQQRASVPSSPALAHLACWLVQTPSLALGHIEHYPPTQEADTIRWLLGWQEALALLLTASFVQAAEQRPTDTYAQETAEAALQLLGWLKDTWTPRKA